MVHVVDGSSEEGSKNLQVCEHGLGARRRSEREAESDTKGTAQTEMRKKMGFQKDEGRER